MQPRRRDSLDVRCWMLDVGCFCFRFLLRLRRFPARHQRTPCRRLRRRIGEMPPTFWEQHGTAIVVGGRASSWRWRLWFCGKMFQPKPPVILPPEVRGARGAGAIAAPAGRWKAVERSLANPAPLCRRARLNLPAGELTTAEFCAALAASEKIGPELAQAISEFSPRMRRAKIFSGRIPAAAA